MTRAEPATVPPMPADLLMPALPRASRRLLPGPAPGIQRLEGFGPVLYVTSVRTLPDDPARAAPMLLAAIDAVSFQPGSLLRVGVVTGGWGGGLAWNLGASPASSLAAVGDPVVGACVVDVAALRALR